MHDGIDVMLGQQALDQRTVHNVALHKNVARIIGHGQQVLRIARIGQFIQIHDLGDGGPCLRCGRAQQVMHEI